MAKQLPRYRDRNVFSARMGCRGRQLDADRARVDALEQTGAERSMHGDAAADDVVNQGFEIVGSGLRSL